MTCNAHSNIQPNPNPNSNSNSNPNPNPNPDLEPDHANARIASQAAACRWWRVGTFRRMYGQPGEQAIGRVNGF